MSNEIRVLISRHNVHILHIMSYRSYIASYCRSRKGCFALIVDFLLLGFELSESVSHSQCLTRKMKIFYQVKIQDPVTIRLIVRTVLPFLHHQYCHNHLFGLAVPSLTPFNFFAFIRQPSGNNRIHIYRAIAEIDKQLSRGSRLFTADLKAQEEE